MNPSNLARFDLVVPGGRERARLKRINHEVVRAFKKLRRAGWAAVALAKFAVASCLVAARFSAAAAEPGSSTSVHTWTNSVPRAFLKDRHLRLYSGAESERVLFEVERKKARVAAQE